MSFVLLWLGVMFPLVFSPGPANIVFAASGAGVGFRRSLPLVLGVDLIFLLKSLLIGYGAGHLFSEFPVILHGLQLLGAGYLFYLAYRFMSSGTSSSASSGNKALGFLDGVLIQLLNAKGWVMVALMFSLFIEPARILSGDLAELTLVAMLFCLNVMTHLAWVGFGDLFGRLAKDSPWFEKQNYFYCFCLAAVGGWLLLDNPVWHRLWS